MAGPRPKQSVWFVDVKQHWNDDTAASHLPKSVKFFVGYVAPCARSNSRHVMCLDAEPPHAARVERIGPVPYACGKDRTSSCGVKRCCSQSQRRQQLNRQPGLMACSSPIQQQQDYLTCSATQSYHWVQCFLFSDTNDIYTFLIFVLLLHLAYMAIFSLFLKKEEEN